MSLLKKIDKRILFVVGGSFCLAFMGFKAGLSLKQAVTLWVFMGSILGVLFFWDLRLGFVFCGSGVLLLIRAVDLESFIKFASLDVVLFLIGMMILVGMLKEAGFFYWAITRFLLVKKLTGAKLFMLLMAISALLSGLMDEVTSIIIMTRLILDISDFFDIDPVPLLLSSVIATNIGSASTVLGNPIGVLIAARGNLTFEDFITHALPVSFFVLIVTLIILFFWYRKYISQLNEKVLPLKDNHAFLYLISIPADRKTRTGIAIFAVTIGFIVFHKRLELLLNLADNTLLLITPIVSAGIVMLYRRDKVRDYVEREVAWSSILFFLFLFALAGAIQYAGIGDFFAKKLLANVGNSYSALTGIMLYSSGFLSSVLDNTVVVASYVPIIQGMAALNISPQPLWWAILFGACYGGNITVIGSTANMVCMDILDKALGKKMNFLDWLKIGSVVGIISMTIAYLMILLFFV